MRTLADSKLVLVAALAAIFAACQPETPVPTASPQTTVPTVTAGDPAALTNPDIPTFDVQSSGTSSGGPCVFSESTGQFTCPDMSRNGITFTRRFTIYDANSNVQSKFDAVTTASIKVETTAKGTTSRTDGATVTIDRSGVMVTSGLAGAETSRTLNGTEAGTVISDFTAPDGAKINTKTSVADTTSNLVIPVSSTTRTDRKAVWPTSGTRVHATVTTFAKGTDTRTMSLTRKETFDGTSVVKVEITTADGTRTCTIDLAAHTTTCGR
ncbi:MAG: hypothetical protein HY700_12000 [Gemmatimonadetes bacterium]|nr:hypothetical protein [Gemmatimonadota bacterium]